MYMSLCKILSPLFCFSSILGMQQAKNIEAVECEIKGLIGRHANVICAKKDLFKKELQYLKLQQKLKDAEDKSDGKKPYSREDFEEGIVVNSIRQEIALFLKENKDVLHIKDGKFSSIGLNAMILSGPKGNGKTTMAQYIAQECDCKLLSLNATDVVKRYYGDGVENIKKLFQDAKIALNNGARGIVIFMDEIDRLAANVDGEQRSEHLAALTELWLQLDALKDEPRILFIGATNHLNKLDETFMDRFMDIGIVKVGNPDIKTRKELIEDFFAKADFLLPEPTTKKGWFGEYKVDEAKRLVNDLAIGTEGCSIRFIKQMIIKITLCARGYEGKKIPVDAIRKILKDKLKDKEATV